MNSGVPGYIVVGRIAAVIAMSFALAVGILLLLAGAYLWGLVAVACFVPSFAGMYLVERVAGAVQHRAQKEPPFGAELD